MWADRRALCFHLVTAKELHNIIRICMQFNGFRVFLMCFEWKKMCVIGSQGTMISSKSPLLEHHYAIGRWITCGLFPGLLHYVFSIYTHRSSTSGSLRVLSFKKKNYLQNKTIPSGEEGSDCQNLLIVTHLTCNIVLISLLILYSSSFPLCLFHLFHSMHCQFSCPAFLFPCLVNRFLKLKKIKFHWKHICVYVPFFNTFNVSSHSSDLRISVLDSLWLWPLILLLKRPKDPKF